MLRKFASGTIGKRYSVTYEKGEYKTNIRLPNLRRRFNKRAREREREREKDKRSNGVDRVQQHKVERGIIASAIWLKFLHFYSLLSPALLSISFLSQFLRWDGRPRPRHRRFPD